jgi:hypothetical protein
MVSYNENNVYIFTFQLIQKKGFFGSAIGHIADKKKGKKHKSCAAYPVHMTCPEDIIP